MADSKWLWIQSFQSHIDCTILYTSKIGFWPNTAGSKPCIACTKGGSPAASARIKPGRWCFQQRRDAGQKKERQVIHHLWFKIVNYSNFGISSKYIPKRLFFAIKLMLSQGKQDLDGTNPACSILHAWLNIFTWHTLYLPIIMFFKCNTCCG